MSAMLAIARQAQLDMISAATPEQLAKLAANGVRPTQSYVPCKFLTARGGCQSMSTCPFSHDGPASGSSSSSSGEEDTSSSSSASGGKTAEGPERRRSYTRRRSSLLKTPSADALVAAAAAAAACEPEELSERRDSLSEIARIRGCERKGSLSLASGSSNSRKASSLARLAVENASTSTPSAASPRGLRRDSSAGAVAAPSRRLSRAGSLTSLGKGALLPTPVAGSPTATSAPRRASQMQRGSFSATSPPSSSSGESDPTLASSPRSSLSRVMGSGPASRRRSSAMMDSNWRRRDSSSSAAAGSSPPEHPEPTSALFRTPRHGSVSVAASGTGFADAPADASVANDGDACADGQPTPTAALFRTPRHSAPVRERKSSISSGSKEAVPATAASASGPPPGFQPLPQRSGSLRSHHMSARLAGGDVSLTPRSSVPNVTTPPSATAAAPASPTLDAEAARRRSNGALSIETVRAANSGGQVHRSSLASPDANGFARMMSPPRDAPLGSSLFAQQPQHYLPFHRA